MKNLLLASVFLAISTPALADLSLEVFDNGTLVGADTSVSGEINFNGSDPNFSTLSLVASGSPNLPGADLTSVTLNVTSATITTTHNLEVDIFQTGVSAPAGTTASTFTANDLVGDPGPTTESTFANGSLVDTTTFSAGTIDGSVGPDLVPWTAITSDAQQYLISFNAPDQTATDTIQFSTSVPEPATWAMLVIGFALLGSVGWRRNRRVNQIG